MSHETILIIDDEADIRDQLGEILADQGYQILHAASAAEARTAVRQNVVDLALLDIWMPEEDGMSLLKFWRDTGDISFPILMISGHGTIETAVEATRLGARDFLEKPFSLDKILLSVENALEIHRLSQRNLNLSRHQSVSKQLIGDSPQMQHLREQAPVLGKHDEPILLWGEEGCELQAVAHQIHFHSARQRWKLVLDSGPDMEGRLFQEGPKTGHCLLLEAHSGSLFLNPLDALSYNGQKRLMSILDNGYFLRKNDTIPIDVRLIAGLRSEPEKALSEGTLEPRTYTRLASHTLYVPPLRERLKDLPQLVTHYVEYYCAQENLHRRYFPEAAIEALCEYRWPRNIQELRQLVYRLLSQGTQAEVTPDDIAAALHTTRQDASCNLADISAFIKNPFREAREEFEKRYYQFQILRSQGRMKDLSQSTGLERTYLYRRIRALGLSLDSEENN